MSDFWLVVVNLNFSNFYIINDFCTDYVLINVIKWCTLIDWLKITQLIIKLKQFYLNYVQTVLKLFDL